MFYKTIVDVRISHSHSETDPRHFLWTVTKFGEHEKENRESAKIVWLTTTSTSLRSTHPKRTLDLGYLGYRKRLALSVFSLSSSSFSHLLRVKQIKTRNQCKIFKTTTQKPNKNPKTTAKNHQKHSSTYSIDISIP